MFFEVYGEHALIQWVMLFAVLGGLILWNEFARRTKLGGAITFFAIPLALTVYFIAIAVGARMGADEPNARVHERLVPLCQTVRSSHRLYRFHDDQVRVGYWR